MKCIKEKCLVSGTKRGRTLPSQIIEVTELVKYYRNNNAPALDGLNLTVTEGRIFTLLGRNGAGKTTFLRIATTQLLPTSGSVSVFGLDVVRDAGAIRRRIAISPVLLSLRGMRLILGAVNHRGMRYG